MNVPKARPTSTPTTEAAENEHSLGRSARVKPATRMRLPARMLTYLIERFSLFTVIPASFLQYLFIARQAGGPLELQNWPTWPVGFGTYLGVFLTLRLSDDLKDKEHDDRYYRDRPLQRGLITVNELSTSMAALVITMTVANAFFSTPIAFAFYVATMGYLALMRVEFFVPHLLGPRLTLYLVTHQLFVPLLAAYVIYYAGGKLAGLSDSLLPELVLLMIMAVEVSRKVRPSYLDNTGRDTYSAYLGRTGVVWFLLGILALAQVLMWSSARVTAWAGLLLLVTGVAVAFSAHPVTGDRSVVLIEAGFGLGEAVVSGHITPDSYTVSKRASRITAKELAYQHVMLQPGKSTGNGWRGLDRTQGERQKLDDDAIRELAELVSAVESVQGHPVDVEWAFFQRRFYIPQSRSITTLE